MAQLKDTDPQVCSPPYAPTESIETWLLKSNRKHLSRKLRLSLAGSCNLRCFFCHNEGQGFGRVGISPFTISDYRLIVRAAVSAGIREVKLTGGEPLLYRDGSHDITDLIASLVQLREDLGADGHFGLSITTNGLLFPRYAERLKQVGLDRVTFSLHTLSESRFRQLIQPTGRNSPHDVLKAIEIAVTNGMTPVKVNTVLFGDESDGNVGEISAIVEACRKSGVGQLRFYTLLSHPDFPDHEHWYRFWDEPLLMKLGMALYGSERQARALVRDALDFLEQATKSVYPKRTLIIEAPGIEVAIEAMESGRFELDAIPDEGPYALRFSAAGELRGLLAADADVIDVAGALAGAKPDVTVQASFAQAMQELLP